MSESGAEAAESSGRQDGIGSLLKRERGVVEECITESEACVRCFRGKHRFKVSALASHLSHANATSNSGAFTVGKHNFELLMFPKGNGKDDYLSLYIRFIGPQSKCHAGWSLKCINQLFPEESIEKGWDKGDQRNEFNRGRHWGWSKFVKRSKLLDPAKGFLKNDVLLFEATVVVVGPTEVSTRPKLTIKNTLGSDLTSLLQSGSFADVIFTLDEGRTELLAHRQILAARSEVLSRMLSGTFRETRQNHFSATHPVGSESSSGNSSGSSKTFVSGSKVAEHDGNKLDASQTFARVCIEDISGNVFRELLFYLYSGTINKTLTGDFPCSDEDFSDERKAETIEGVDCTNEETLPSTSSQVVPSSGSRLKRPRSESFESRKKRANLSTGSGSENNQVIEKKKSSLNGVCLNDEEEDSPNDIIIGLMIAADKYNLIDLRSSCEHYLIEIMDEECVFDLLRAADLCGAKDLKKCCIDFLCAGNVDLDGNQLKELPKDVLVDVVVQRFATRT